MSKDKKKITYKQIAAWVAIILLVLLYLTALILSIFAKHVPENMWLMCILATMFVPLVTWVYIWLYGRLTGTETFLDKPEPEEKRWDSQDVE